MRHNRFLEAILAHGARADAPPALTICTKSGLVDYSYGTLIERARRYAVEYRRLGIGDGQIVCIVLPTGLDIYAAFLGAMLIGAIPTIFPHPSPIQDADYYRRQQRDALGIVRPHVLVVTEAVARAFAQEDILAPAGSPATVIAETVTGRPEGEVEQLPDAAAIALLQHSSGTTGLKKGVALSYRAILEQVDCYAPSLGLAPGRPFVVGTWLPLFHDMGLIACFVMPFFLGGHVVAIDPFEWIGRPTALLEMVPARRVTHVWMPNFAFRLLARLHPEGSAQDLSCVLQWINCSEPCRKETMDDFLRCFGRNGVTPERVKACYAMAETVFAVSQTPSAARAEALLIGPEPLTAGSRVAEVSDAGAPGRWVVANGPPIAGCEVRVLADGTFVGEGVVGELCVRAGFLFEGYFRRAEETQAAIYDGRYRTGDLGFVLRHQVYIVGRIKELIIVNGRNLLAGDIEFEVNQVPGVKAGRAVAFGVYSETVGSEQLIIVAERDPASPREAAAIRRDILHLASGVFGVMPRDVRVTGERWLVKSTSGKISREENRRKYLGTDWKAATATASS